jgi:CBS domain containing-hemolysin-like protein
MTALIVVIVISLSVSFVCSVLEAVLLSVSQAHVALLEERGDPAGPIWATLRREIDEPIAAILTLNTIAHTVGAAVSGAIALQVFGSQWMAAFSAVLTLLILVLSEIIPKTIGARHWQRLAPLSAHVLRGMIVVLRPVLVPLSAINRLVGAGGHGPKSVSRAELEILAEIGRREGQIDDAEWRVVTNMLRLRDVMVSEVMTPRTAIVAVPASATPEEAQAVMLNTGFLRIPVHAEDIDQIVGILLARDLWRGIRAGTATLAPLLREPLFVPQTRPVEELIADMRRQRIKMAVVLDEYGGTAGLVTLEDLVEEIVGEIQDEHEVDLVPFERISSTEMQAAGGVAIASLSERLGAELPLEDYDTIGGFVFGALGRLPHVGDVVPFDGGRIEVLAMDKRRVARVLIAVDETMPSRRQE